MVQIRVLAPLDPHTRNTLSLLRDVRQLATRKREVVPRVLFVCTANLQRSPTAEDLFQKRNGVWQTKSAGGMPFLGRNLLTQQLIDWADLIVVTEPHQLQNKSRKTQGAGHT